MEIRQKETPIDVGLIRTDASEENRFLVYRIRPLCHCAFNASVGLDDFVPALLLLDRRRLRLTERRHADAGPVSLDIRVFRRVPRDAAWDPGEYAL